MTECFIYDHVRTPRGEGKPTGALHGVPPVELASTVLKTIRDRNELDTNLVEDVVLGCLEPVGEQGSNIARVAAVHAGYPDHVPGIQINRFCASSLESVNTVTAKVKAGFMDCAIGGGVESMSRVPLFAGGGPWYADPDVYSEFRYLPQGIAADLIATVWNFSRDDLDAYAVESQARAARAWDEGRFDRSVVAVRDQFGDVLLDHDEHVRRDVDMQKLGALEPSFARLGRDAGFDEVALEKYPQIERLEHFHHPGNTCGVVDGACAILLGNGEAGQRMGLTPRARIVSFESVGSEPCIMLTGPAAATRGALKRAGMELGDIDLFELNEAFASVVLVYQELLGIDHDKINVNGGAIAMGHPLGATGGVVLGTVLDELERRDLSTALVTLCVGTGMGIATIIERV